MARDQNYIGSYRLLKLVRAGASCQIWEAMSEVDNRRCALKALQEENRGDKEQIALLKHEYLVGHELQNSNVIEVYDFDVNRGLPYVALEYFESSNLKQWIRQTRDSKQDRTTLPGVISQCASGLQYLHAQGWIHCDIKPDNFLINTDFEVKLIDFAIAQKERKGLGRFFGGRGKIQGTRSYMSPEQIRGESLDPRSDIYSFGCMLFELSCGRPPFTGGSPDELLQKHLRAQVPNITASSETTSQEYSKLVARMMSKKPDDRPATMSEFLEEFSKIRVTRANRR
ncbi:MAG: serine/threonine protein kinase [Planctomycetaceae bacterium]|nr:serine/threonine protein kinase [Planctomycetaceae bacterium]